MIPWLGDFFSNRGCLPLSIIHVEVGQQLTYNCMLKIEFEGAWSLFEAAKLCS